MKHTVDHKDPRELQDRIGYTFHNKKILETALTRKMYLNEREDTKSECMKPLSTVGDAILGAATVTWLYKSGTRDSGTLTKERSRKVKREMTRAKAERLELECYVHWGQGEEGDEIWKTGTRAFDTAFEALIGAVFLDAQETDGNGLEVVEKMLDNLNFFDSPDTTP